jgi:hypothetical protein
MPVASATSGELLPPIGDFNVTTRALVAISVTITELVESLVESIFRTC